MKLLRGAWTEGLSAIHPILTQQKGKILRPFLQTRRAEIESFLKSINQPWREDSTNADTAFTRNKIRHELLPSSAPTTPILDQTLANLAELAREEESRWQTELARILPQLLLPGKPVRGGGRAVSTAPSEASISIELDRLRALDPALRRRVLRAAARQLGARLSFDETSRLLALCGFRSDPTVAARTGSTLHLSNGLRANAHPANSASYRALPELTPSPGSRHLHPDPSFCSFIPLLTVTPSTRIAPKSALHPRPSKVTSRFPF